MESQKKRTKVSSGFKNTLFRAFLFFSIVCSFILVNNCKDNVVNQITSTEDDGTIRPPDFGGGESSSILTSVFKTVGEAAAGEVTETGVDWVMSSLGLINESPDYTEQLDKIDEDLQIVIAELNDISQELTRIDAELQTINCSEWASQLSTQKGRIDHLMNLYSTYVSTAKTGGRVDSATIAAWVDQVLAEGNYVSQTSMDQILDEIADQLYQPINSGIIPACVQTITLPEENSFGKDTVYYNQVKLYTDYYFSYQVRGLLLLNEALHYKAWVAAGSPNSDELSADSTSYVCQNTNAKVYCNLSATAVNNLYNALISQFTAGGAPYSDGNLVMMYKSSGAWLWPKSLEDFTTAAGDNCADPLTSANPCGITAGFYNTGSMQSVIYKGYSGWLKAGKDLLTDMLAGWKSGTAGDYLQNNFGFQNMKNKIIISSNTVRTTLDKSGLTANFLQFFDTDLDYSFTQGFVSSQSQYDILSPRSESSGATGCGFATIGFHYTYSTNSKLPTARNNFYTMSGRVDYASETQAICNGFRFYTTPGWVASNTGDIAIQYRWPVRSIDSLVCTGNRSNKNAGSMPTLCGDDFTAWFDYYIPRPETCDNPGAGVQCNFDAGTLTRAKNKFNVKNKKKNNS